MNQHLKCIFLTFLTIFWFGQNYLIAQHNQWVTPLTLQRSHSSTVGNWTNTYFNKNQAIAYGSDKSTYFANDYFSGNLSLGGTITSPIVDESCRGLIIAKVDSSGLPQWLKVISIGNQETANETCYSSIYKLNYDSLRDRLWFSFKPCRSGLIDSFPYVYQKNYLGAVSAQTGQVVFLKEVPEMYDFYLGNLHITALTYQKESEFIDGELWERGTYLSTLDFSGNIIDRKRLINTDPDPENPPPFPTTGVVINGFYKAPNGNSIIVGATYDPSLYKHPTMVGTTLIDTTYYSSLFIINVSPTGESNWSKIIYSTISPTTWTGSVSNVTTFVDDDGSVVLSARFFNDILIDNELFEYQHNPSSFLANRFIININSQGQTIWKKAFEVVSWPAGVCKNELEEVVFVGTTSNQVNNNGNLYTGLDSTMHFPRLFMLKFDTTGHVVNSKLIDGHGFAYNVKSISKNEQLIYGRYNRGVTEDSVFRVGFDAINTRLGGASFGYFVARTDFNEFPEQTRLSSEQLLIYANPNTGECDIRIPLDLYNSPVLYLDIFDEVGQLISQRILNYQKADYRLNISSHANGIYPVRLSNGYKSYFGKIVLVK